MYLFRLLFLLGCLGVLLPKNIAQVNADFEANVTTGCGSLAVSFSDLSTSTGGTITSWNWDLGGVTVMTQQAGRIFPEGLFEICLTVTDSGGNSDTECKTDYIQVLANPIADFEVDDSQGCSPLEVVFTDLSSSPDGAIVEWIWGVGGSVGVIVDDGTLPSIENVYDIPDEYNISLTISDENGCVGTITKQNFIKVSPDPDIQISVDNDTQCLPPFTVNFTNENIEQNTNYIWDFGVGNNFIGANPPAVTYTNSGSFDVVVIGINTVTGCLDTLLLEDYIIVGNPIDFTYDQSEVCLGEPVTFEDMSSTVATSILWDFGDGNIDTTSANPSHTYDAPGCYTVSLTRTEDGCETTIESDVCIEVYDLPAATFNSNNSAGCMLPHMVTFFGIAPDAVSWNWEFGENGEIGTSTLQNPSITITEFGIYPIYLTVTDGNGCSNTVSVDTVNLIELDAQLPDGQIRGCSPLTFNLMDESATSAPIISWNWEINTPSGLLTSTDANPSFTIADTGCFNVQLIVTNALGCIDTSLINEAVCVGFLPTVNFEATPQNACINSDVTFTDLSSPFVNEWFWEFGDGTESFMQNPTHEYVDTGSFDVTLFASHYGCINQLTIPDFIETLAPKAKFKLERLCNDPFSIQFTNQSIGATSMNWDFGDLTTTTDVSTIDTPMYTYPDTGVYEILLVTTNSMTGCVDTASVDYYITDPKAEYTFDITEGCAPLTITVEDNSAFASEYQWFSADGDISENDIAQPEITYTQPGSYSDILLVITDVNDCQDTLQYSGEIKVNGVDADFIASPDSGCNPLPVILTDNSSSLFGNVISWDWNIANDLVTSTDQSLNYTFDSAATYPLTLTATDDWGCIGTIEVPDAIIVTEPEAKFRGDTLGCTLMDIKFKNQSVGVDLSYAWTFGDGGTSTQKSPTHIYTNEGIYTVCLTVIDVNGCTGNFCLDDYVRIANPIASFVSDTTTASCPPLIVNFENTSLNATSFEWDFGDGSGSSSLENPPHVYTTPGVYDVTLIASSNDACKDTFAIQEYINLDGPLGQFTFELNNPCIPTEVTFFAESNDFYTYIWDYGDGILDTSGFKMTDTITHLYTQNFDAVPNLILVDNQGCSRPIPPIDTLELVFLEIAFEASKTTLCNDNVPVTFTNLTESSVPIVGVEWIFEGGAPATSTDLEPDVIYNNPGTFDVTLIIDNGACMDTLLVSDYIGVGEIPTADFTMMPDTGCAPLPVSFFDNSSITTGFIQSWEWDFGNGEISTEQNPVFVFPEGGDIPVQLKVTTNQGCVDSTIHMLHVFPEVLVTVSNDTTICMGESAEIIAEFISDTTGVSYTWQSHPTLSCTDCLNPIVNPLDTTEYIFTALSPEGCEYNFSVTVNVRPDAVPVISISNDTTICGGDVAQIFVSGGDNIFGYNWDTSSDGLTCYNACSNPIASPISNTTYTVTVTNSSGCSSIDSTTVNVFYEFQDIVGNDRTICLGDTAHLQVLTGNNPTWIAAEGLNCSSCADPIATPTETTTYIVRVETDFGCIVFDSITINILSSLDIDAGDNIEICEGQTAQLTGFGDGIPSWSPASTLNQTDILNPIASPDSNTMYYFSLENGDCILTDSVEVIIKNKTDIELLDQSICEGEAFIMQPIGFADEFQWSPPEGLNNTQIENPLAAPTETTEYTVIAKLGTCIPDTATAILEVIKKPQVQISSVYQFFPGEGVILNIDEIESGDYIYQWTPGIGLSCTDCQNPTALIDSAMNYLVIVTDSLTGCSITKDVLVRRVDECSEELISMPNAFTPNGDGENDFYQMFSGLIDEIVYFRVYNRWGGIVYETDDRYFQWDGKVNGRTLPSGVYIYALEGICKINGSTILKKGDITIHN